MNPQYSAVLVVSEDDRPVIDRFGRWMCSNDTYVAEGVGDAATALSANLDVVLVAPAAVQSFGSVLVEKIRTLGLPCQCAALLDADAETIVPGFDEYLPIEISRSAFEACMTRLVCRTAFCHALDAHFDLVNVKASKPHVVDECRFDAEIEASRSTLSTLTSRFDARDYRALFRSLGDDWSLA